MRPKSNKKPIKKMMVWIRKSVPCIVCKKILPAKVSATNIEGLLTLKSGIVFCGAACKKTFDLTWANKTIPIRCMFCSRKEQVPVHEVIYRCLCEGDVLCNTCVKDDEKIRTFTGMTKKQWATAKR